MYTQHGSENSYFGRDRIAKEKAVSKHILQENVNLIPDIAGINYLAKGEQSSNPWRGCWCVPSLVYHQGGGFSQKAHVTDFSLCLRSLG